MIFLQGTFTPLVHAHAGRTQANAVGRGQGRAADLSVTERPQLARSGSRGTVVNLWRSAPYSKPTLGNQSQRPNHAADDKAVIRSRDDALAGLDLSSPTAQR